jgi:hypothetical protein
MNNKYKARYAATVPDYCPEWRDRSSNRKNKTEKCTSTVLFVIPWHISQHRNTWTVKMTSKCDPHTQSDILEVYFYMLGALSFVGGHQGSRLSEYGCNGSRDETVLRWPPKPPDLTPWNMLRTLSFYRLCHRICLIREDESSLPSQKSMVTFCRG